MLMKKNESGFVSIIVAALIMIILSLLTIGFTRLMQREQRQSLDRQLSRQALYAAESGINDVYRALQTNAALATEKTTCDTSVLVPDGVEITSPDGTLEYTCILYDKDPKELEYNLSTMQSQLAELKSKDGKNIASITFRWGPPEGSPAFVYGACDSSLPASYQAALLHIDMSRVGSTGYNRANLQNSADNFYFKPCRDGASPAAGTAASQAYSPATKGDLVNVVCASSGAQPCSATLTFSSGETSTGFFARLQSMYEAGRVTISAQQYQAGTSGPTEDMEFLGGQTSIDVTARSNDVIRRLRVAVPVSGSTVISEAAVQVFDGMCKQLSVLPPNSAADICSY